MSHGQVASHCVVPAPNWLAQQGTKGGSQSQNVFTKTHWGGTTQLHYVEQQSTVPCLIHAVCSNLGLEKLVQASRSKRNCFELNRLKKLSLKHEMVFARLGSNKVKQLSHVKPITQQLLLLLRLASSQPVPTSGHPTPAATCPICQGPRHCQQSMLQLGRLPTKWSDLSRRNSDSRIPIDWDWYSLWISPMSWYKAAFPRGKLQARNTKAVSWSVLVCLDQVSIWDLQRLEHFTLIRTSFCQAKCSIKLHRPVVSCSCKQVSEESTEKSENGFEIYRNESEV